MYRLFGSKRAILSAVLDVAFGGDDEPIAFGDRPAVQAAFAQADAGALIDGFGTHRPRATGARRGHPARTSPEQPPWDAEAAEHIGTSPRQQRLTGQSRVAAELARRNALASWAHRGRGRRT